MRLRMTQMIIRASPCRSSSNRLKSTLDLVHLPTRPSTTARSSRRLSCTKSTTTARQTRICSNVPQLITLGVRQRRTEGRRGLHAGWRDRRAADNLSELRNQCNFVCGDLLHRRNGARHEHVRKAGGGLMKQQLYYLLHSLPRRGRVLFLSIER